MGSPCLGEGRPRDGVRESGADMAGVIIECSHGSVVLYDVTVQDLQVCCRRDRAHLAGKDGVDGVYTAGWLSVRGNFVLIHRWIG